MPKGQTINISGLTPVDDPEYRYKMPAVFGKIEGSGNGIKTAIPNISDVALSLHRAPGEVNKFFGCELGAQTTYNENTDRAIVNGAHTDDTLQKLMHRYIEGFVICPTCGLVGFCFVRFRDPPSVQQIKLCFASRSNGRSKALRRNVVVIVIFGFFLLTYHNYFCKNPLFLTRAAGNEI